MGVSVGLTRTKDGRFEIELGSAALPRIVFDPEKLDPETRKEEHMGARLLLAAALACYVNTMAGDLKRRGASRIGEIRARAGIEKDRDSTMRTRYTNFEINLETPVAPEDREIFDAVRNSLLRGSLVTYSLEEGIEPDYNIEAL